MTMFRAIGLSVAVHAIVAISLLALTTLGCSCTSTTTKLDPESAVTAGDLTALISGCGEQLGVGYLVCRVPEGTSASDGIYFHAPPDLKCDDENACVYFRIYFPGGRPTYEGVVKKGESFARVPWREIINKEAFDLSDRGFYGVSFTLHYRGPGGEPMKTFTNGYIILHVVRRNYLSLLENEQDENFVWKWKTPSNQTVKMTTGARVYVSPPKRGK